MRRSAVRTALNSAGILLLVLLLSLLINIDDAGARPPLSISMTSAGPRRFPAPYGYGITVTYQLENFDPDLYTIVYYQVQVDEGNGVWRTTHSRRPTKYEWANIHGNVKCNDDLYNLPSGANVLVRVRANYQPRYEELEDDRFTSWSDPIPATVALWGCPGGSDTTNSCVVDVVDQVKTMENHSPGEITLRTEVPAGDWGSPEDAMMRYPQLWSDTEGGDSGLITATVPLSDYWYHPGGIQSIGQHAIVGMDGGSAPYNSVKIFKVGAYGVTEVNSALVPTKAQSVGIVNEADGRYLVTVGSSSSKVLDFYRTTGTSLSDPLMRVGRWEWTAEGFADGSIDNKHINYQNLNPVRECGTNKLFLLASGRESTWFDGGEFTGHDYVHVFEVLTPIRDDPRYPEYDIAFVLDDGSLHFYGMEHGFTPAWCSISRDRRFYPGCDPNKPSIFKIRFDELW
jgi:hypothetical protein